MIPKSDGLLRQPLVFEELPTNTYKLNIEKNTISGFVDGLAAMKQAVYLILSIERYEHLIYSWNYGVELASLFGRPISFVLPEIKRRITEALTQDTRITGVDNFNFEQGRNLVHAYFTVHTVFGALEAEKAVNI